jgi:hypothetical protein
MRTVVIACPECGDSTVTVFFEGDGEGPKRAQYRCLCLSLVGAADPVIGETDEHGLVRIDPSAWTLEYVEKVKQAALFAVNDLRMREEA